MLFDGLNLVSMFIKLIVSIHHYEVLVYFLLGVASNTAQI